MRKTANQTELILYEVNKNIEMLFDRNNQEIRNNIMAITDLAMLDRNLITQVAEILVERSFQERVIANKINLLYVIDNLIKTIGADFIYLITPHIFRIFEEAYISADEENKINLFKLYYAWKYFLDPIILGRICDRFSFNEKKRALMQTRPDMIEKYDQFNESIRIRHEEMRNEMARQQQMQQKQMQQNLNTNLPRINNNLMQSSDFLEQPRQLNSVITSRNEKIERDKSKSKERIIDIRDNYPREREQTREHFREQTRVQTRDQMIDQTRVQTRDQMIDQTRDKTRDQIRDQTREHSYQKPIKKEPEKTPPSSSILLSKAGLEKSLLSAITSSSKNTRKGKKKSSGRGEEDLFSSDSSPRISGGFSDKEEIDNRYQSEKTMKNKPKYTQQTKPSIQIPQSKNSKNESKQVKSDFDQVYSEKLKDIKIEKTKNPGSNNQLFLDAKNNSWVSQFNSNIPGNLSEKIKAAASPKDSNIKFFNEDSSQDYSSNKQQNKFPQHQASLNKGQNVSTFLTSQQEILSNIIQKGGNINLGMLNKTQLAAVQNIAKNLSNTPSVIREEPTQYPLIQNNIPLVNTSNLPQQNNQDLLSSLTEFISKSNTQLDENIPFFSSIAELFNQTLFESGILKESIKENPREFNSEFDILKIKDFNSKDSYRDLYSKSLDSLYSELKNCCTLCGFRTKYYIKYVQHFDIHFHINYIKRNSGSKVLYRKEAPSKNSWITNSNNLLINQPVDQNKNSVFNTIKYNNGSNFSYMLNAVLYYQHDSEQILGANKTSKINENNEDNYNEQLIYPIQTNMERKCVYCNEEFKKKYIYKFHYWFYINVVRFSKDEVSAVVPVEILNTILQEEQDHLLIHESCIEEFLSLLKTQKTEGKKEAELIMLNMKRNRD
jgi:hypothetical protein